MPTNGVTDERNRASRLWRLVRHLFSRRTRIPRPQSAPSSVVRDPRNVHIVTNRLTRAQNQCIAHTTSHEEQELASQAQLLPPEILLIILRNLIPPSLPPIHGPYFTGFTKDHWRRTGLLNSILTCRAWSQAGTELLYSIPILQTGKRAQLFTRTLRECPEMAPMVRQLRLVDHDNFSIYQRGALLKRLGPDFFEELRNEKQLARKDLLDSLQACTSLTTITLVYNIRYTGTDIPLERTFLPGSSVGARLRRLEIYGDGLLQDRTAPLMSRNVYLPALETLSLHGFLFITGHEFPVFPKLHTLQVSRGISLSSPRGLRINAHHFPVLRTLHLSQNDPQLGTTIDDDCLRGIQQLMLIGDAELDLFLSKRGRPCMDGIQDLTLRLWNRSSLLASLYTPSERLMPRDLERLTVLIKYRTGLRFQPGRAEKTLIRDLHEALASGTHACESFGSLLVVRDLDIMISDSDEVRSSFKALRKFCGSRGITMQVIHYG